jgi:succinyl-diaminopimelate desuccinylase
MPDPAFDRAIAFAADLIRIPGPPGGEGEVAARTKLEMENLGFDDAWVDESGNAVGRIRGAGHGAAVMLSCHLDVVDIGDPADWEFPPYGGVVEGGFLHGRGAMDIKGPLALQTYAAARFLEDRLPGDVIVAHTVMEERGGWGMESLLERGEVRPDIVIIGESTGGDVCIGHRGRAELIVEVRGTAGHASAPDRARNPLFLMAKAVPMIAEFSDSLGDNAVLGHATATPTSVEALPSSYNVIPDIARIVVDWRVLPDTTADGAVQRLDAFLRQRLRIEPPFELEVRFSHEEQRTWTGTERDRRMFTPGFLMDPAHPVVTAAAAAVAASTGRAPAVRPWTFATDGGHTCGVHAIPTIGYAPGEERHAHTNRERLDLSAARTAFDAHPPLIRAVQAAAERRSD